MMGLFFDWGLPMYKVIAFDAFGTLFDVYSIAKCVDQIYPGQGRAVSMMWRDRQIEYTRLVSMADPSENGSRFYTSFWDLTIKALHYTCARLKLPLDEAIEQQLMHQYAQLDVFVDVVPVLREIQKMGTPMAILSNGSREMLSRVVNKHQLNTYFDALLSVDEIRHFKVMPASYDLILRRFACQKEEVLFVSCNAWDVVGASWFGLPTYWVNRSQLPYETIGNQPTYQSHDLNELQNLIAG
jgi:2-haloacid dehalogenase